MNRSRTLSAFAAAALVASLLTGCSDSGADAEPLAEPTLDFPQTSTTATPTPTPTEDDEDEETTTSTSTTAKKSSSSSSSSTKSSTRTSTKSSSKRSESRSSNDSNNAAREPEPVRETIVDDRPGATCAWPTQGAASGNQEYSTFCDREWARTVTSDGQDYYWAAKGQGWVSVDPVTTDDGGICWAREDFETAPEAIRNAVAFCDPASGEEAE
ncbi:MULTISPECIES: hypothetical protein [Corynebacterium]|uniref:Secreted protein n=1 Tax=Corynebacterium lehmanniae TaxID=2913497 RepID=A0ABT4R884_9CORY|nr:MULTISPECIES: hypothetical protein [Corynebacterium]MCG7290245.1 hypothetical protein [Corynebacterium sp. ACRPZ]MCG7294247.1 hypothetical protein [Corynebacterium sp. ACRPY]MCZ9291719.1 hypothetical protein [Corynebacterium lehmanniae]